LVLEKYCIFLKAELSCIVESPTFEKSERFKDPFLSDGDSNKCEGLVLKLSRDLAW
jgi:hypothetical protein